MDAEPHDAAALVYSAAARQRLVIGNTLYFAVTGDTNTGNELYAISIETPSTPPPPVVVEGKRGGGGSPGVWEMLALLALAALRLRSRLHRGS